MVACRNEVITHIHENLLIFPLSSSINNVILPFANSDKLHPKFSSSFMAQISASDNADTSISSSRLELRFLKRYSEYEPERSEPLEDCMIRVPAK